jgi:hypothetical protein
MAFSKCFDESFLRLDTNVLDLNRLFEVLTHHLILSLQEAERDGIEPSPMD